MLKPIGILLIAIAIVIMNMLGLMAAEQPTQEVRPKTETVSIVEQHYGTPKAEKHIFVRDEFRAEIVTTSDPKVIRIIQLDSLGHEVPHLQQFVIFKQSLTQLTEQDHLRSQLKLELSVLSLLRLQLTQVLPRF